MNKATFVVIAMLLIAGCDKVEKKVLKEQSFGDSRIIQYAPMGDATVDNYLMIAVGKAGDKNVKTVMTIKGKTSPLEIEIRDRHSVDIHVNKSDVENMDFFDCGISGGRVRMVLEPLESR